MTPRSRFSSALAATALMTLVFAISPAVSSSAAPLEDDATLVAVGDGPTGLAYSPDGSHLYVTNVNDGTISDIDPATGTVTRTILLSVAAPAQVVFSSDGTRAYVSSYTDNSIAFIDVANATQVNTFTELSGAMDLVLSPDDSTLYVAEWPASSVAVISLAGDVGTRIHTINTGPAPASVALTPSGDGLFITVYSDSALYFIATADYSVTSVSSTGTNPWPVSVSPDGRWLAIGHDTTTATYVTDLVASTLSYVSGRSFGNAFSPNSSYLFTTSFSDNTFTVTDLSDPTSMTTYALSLPSSAPRDVAVSPDGCQVAIAGQGVGTVYLYQTESCSGGADVAELPATGMDSSAQVMAAFWALVALVTGGLVLRRRLRVTTADCH